MYLTVLLPSLPTGRPREVKWLAPRSQCTVQVSDFAKIPHLALTTSHTSRDQTLLFYFDSSQVNSRSSKAVLRHRGTKNALLSNARKYSATTEVKAVLKELPTTPPWGTFTNKNKQPLKRGWSLAGLNKQSSFCSVKKHKSVMITGPRGCQYTHKKGPSK